MRLAAILAVVVLVGCGSGGSKPDGPSVPPPDTAPAAPDAAELLDGAPPPQDAALPDASAEARVVADSAGDATAADASADATAAAPDAAPDLPPPMPVTMQFAGTVATVAGTPLGLSDSARTTAITGTFTYDLRTPDSLPADAKRGRYLHGNSSGFTFSVMGHTVEGSGFAVVETEDFDPDTFRFRDGPGLDPVPRIMKVDGTAAPALKLNIAITDGSGAFFQTDALPDPFPALNIATTPHTFSLMDGGGTLLMQLTALTRK